MGEVISLYEDYEGGGDYGEEVRFERPRARVAESRKRRAAPLDLSGKPKIIMAVGRGRTGKTSLLRWLAEQAIEEGRPVMMADLDPTNASFGAYFPDGKIAQPKERTNAASRIRFLQGFLQAAIQRNEAGGAIVSALLDLGGGDTTLREMLAAMPDLAGALEASGAHPVLLYLLGPSEDDLPLIDEIEALGFNPKATALISNEGTAPAGYTREEAFERVHRHSIYRRVVERGAAEVWMPILHAAAQIEPRRVTYAMARDGLVREGSSFPPLGFFDRLRVKRWLEEMDRDFAEAGIASWLP